VRRQRDRLEAQAERLQEMDAAKSRFFANISHEFRTPLTLIRGPLQEVRERLRRADADLDAAADQLALAERNTDRLHRLIDQILGLARMDAGTYELAARPIDLESEVRRIVRPFEPLAERHDLALAVAVDEAPAPHGEPIYCDREALEHMLGNLLSNAIKFTPDGGRVTVTVTEAADHATLAVTDTGPGIPPGQQDAVFDRFSQVDEGPAGDQTGIGVGLAFTKDLVELHGGTIELDSAEGEGTTVTVRLRRGRAHFSDDQLATAPSASAPPSTTAPSVAAPDTAGAAASPPAPSGSGTKTVLLVDDNADVRRYVRSVLAPEYAVVTAPDGRAGLKQAREALPDCILADVMMPELDGVAMTRHLRQDPATASIPVVMLTARAGPEHEVEGLTAGADDYVTKPFDAAVLRARVAGMIQIRLRLRRRIQAELHHRREKDDAPADASTLIDPAPPPDAPPFVQKVRAAIEDRLADPDLSVEALARTVAVSRSTLYRRLKEQTGQTPSQFVQKVRIEHGARLLRRGKGTVTEVAYAVGFESLSYFSRQFRDHLGQPPSDYAEAMG
jgi:CheY-like chemotaxis protein/predicted DNA-binding transcriptional regulator AlpA